MSRSSRAFRAALGGDHVALPCNLSDGAAVDQLVPQAVEALGGKLDILVNNAGVTRDNLLMRMKDEEFEEVIRINLEAAFRLMRAAARPMMKARFGRIISITSVVGVTGNPGQANYVASKAGLIGMTKAVAQELASRGITVNAIAPGFMTSAMTDALNEQQRESILARIPMGADGQRRGHRRGGASISPAARPVTSRGRRCTSTAGWRCSDAPAPGEPRQQAHRSRTERQRQNYGERPGGCSQRRNPDEGQQALAPSRSQPFSSASSHEECDRRAGRRHSRSRAHRASRAARPRKRARCARSDFSHQPTQATEDAKSRRDALDRIGERDRAAPHPDRREQAHDLVKAGRALLDHDIAASAAGCRRTPARLASPRSARVRPMSRAGEAAAPSNARQFLVQEQRRNDHSANCGL